MLDNSKLFVSIDKESKSPAVLKVVGVGGAGCNAIESMIKRGINGVEFIAINTDVQDLTKSSANHKIQIGKTLTRGLGAGSDPTIGRKAAEENKDEITELLKGTDMMFLTCGQGGGTGTGASPVIASIAKSLGILVIAIVTKPFNWEGKIRIQNAEKGILELKQYVDSLIVISNERILNIIDQNTPFTEALENANNILYEATRGISDIINVPGFINVDFADVRTIMTNSGEAILGCGVAKGENRAIEAAQLAISSPLLEGSSIRGAKNILINVSGPTSMSLHEITEANKIISDAAGNEANIIFGIVNRDDLNDGVSYTVVATGFNNKTNTSNNGKFKETKTLTNNKPNFLGKIFSNTEVDSMDFDVPTILRSNKDFNPDEFSLIDNNSNSKKNDKLYDIDDDNDEIDGFLKKIMD